MYRSFTLVGDICRVTIPNMSGSSSLFPSRCIRIQSNQDIAKPHDTNSESYDRKQKTHNVNNTNHLEDRSDSVHSTIIIIEEN